MSFARCLIVQRHLAALLCAAALALKLLVPTGYMVSVDHGRPAITICAGVESQAMPGMATPDRHHGRQDHGKPDAPCAFAGLSAAALATPDAVPIAALIAFVLALGHEPWPPLPPLRRGYLRPPLRGPPLHA